jgi:hypothetical protein
MGLSSFWEKLSNLGAFEDPKVYTDELKDVRRELRAWGLKCLGCGKHVTPSLSEIEEGVRRRQNGSMGFAMGGSFVAWQPSWGEGSVCKHCKGVICGACTEKGIDPEAVNIFGGAIPICPKCGHGVQGIDHLTD